MWASARMMQLEQWFWSWALACLLGFRHARIGSQAHVRLRFKLPAGGGGLWTRDGSIPQGCPLSMMFIVALCLPWCRYLEAQVRVSPSYMQITSSVFAGTLVCCFVQQGSMLGM